ncbi:MAG: hypothetical protein HYW65_01255 [Candidatus Liptonbacteria bacterium]|nr:hypothetical protein [Candidatus Liptonbacteria bacterium]
MTRWALLGAMLGAFLAVFLWWRGGVLRDLPSSPPAFSTSTSPLPPLITERDTLLRFEGENLAARVKELGGAVSGGTARESVPAAARQAGNPSSSAALSAPPAKQAAGTPPASPVQHASSVPATSTATRTATGTPIFIPPPTTTYAPAYRNASRQFLIDGRGFCVYQPNSAVVLSGYPLVLDMAIQGGDIKSWTDDRVIFWVSDSVPPGTYRVEVRGVNQFGYCTTTTSSPQSITVK